MSISMPRDIISSRAKTENNPYVLVKHCTEHAVDLPPDGDTDSTTGQEATA